MILTARAYLTLRMMWQTSDDDEAIGKVSGEGEEDIKDSSVQVIFADKPECNTRVVFEEASAFRFDDFLARAGGLVNINAETLQSVRFRRIVFLDRLLADNGIEPFLMRILDERSAQEACTRLVDMLLKAAGGWGKLEEHMVTGRSLRDIGFDPFLVQPIERMGNSASAERLENDVYHPNKLSQ